MADDLILPSDEEIQQEQAAGEQLLLSARESGHFYKPRVDFDNLSNRDLLKAMKARMDSSPMFALAITDLFRKAYRLSYFMEDRLGPHEEWPLMMIGEVDQLFEFDRLAGELFEVVNILAPETPLDGETVG